MTKEASIYEGEKTVFLISGAGRDFPGGSGVKNQPSNKEKVDSNPGLETKISHTRRQLSPHATTKRPCGALKTKHRQKKKIRKERGAGKTGQPHVRMKSEHSLAPYTRLNSNRLKTYMSMCVRVC